jgi:hypothetical protein
LLASESKAPGVVDNQLHFTTSTTHQ